MQSRHSFFAKGFLIVPLTPEIEEIVRERLVSEGPETRGAGRVDRKSAVPRRRNPRNLQPTSLSNAWIFQSNPQIYDLTRALIELEEQVWRVSRYHNEMQIGDTVYLWEAGPEGGFVAVAKLSSLPAFMPEPTAQLPFIRKPETFAGSQLRVTLSRIRLLSAKLPKKAVRKAPELAALHVFRCPRGTNFRLTAKEAEALLQLVRSYSLTSWAQVHAGHRRVILSPSLWP